LQLGRALQMAAHGRFLPLPRCTLFRATLKPRRSLGLSHSPFADDRHPIPSRAPAYAILSSAGRQESAGALMVGLGDVRAIGPQPAAVALSNALRRSGVHPDRGHLGSFRRGGRCHKRGGLRVGGTAARKPHQYSVPTVLHGVGVTARAAEPDQEPFPGPFVARGSAPSSTSIRKAAEPCVFTPVEAVSINRPSHRVNPHSIRLVLIKRRIPSRADHCSPHSRQNHHGIEPFVISSETFAPASISICIASRSGPFAGAQQRGCALSSKNPSPNPYCRTDDGFIETARSDRFGAACQPATNKSRACQLVL